jgi:hypothetical protein
MQKGALGTTRDQMALALDFMQECAEAFLCSLLVNLLSEDHVALLVATACASNSTVTMTG